MSKNKLSGTGVLVTRPVGQAMPLLEAIKDIGGAPHLFPGVEIVEKEGSEIASSLSRAASAQLLIFVSPTAARIAMKATARKRGLLDCMQVAAVGQSTADELIKHGVREIIVPDKGSGSEALLGCTQLKHVAGKSVLVVRGEGGSDLLATALRGRGAEVSFLECYRRVLPEGRFAEIEPLLRDGRIAAWTATSGEIVDNLFYFAGKHGDLLQKTPLFVNHSNVAARAFSRAVKTIFVAAGGDTGLARSVANWFSRFRPEMD